MEVFDFYLYTRHYYSHHRNENFISDYEILVVYEGDGRRV